VTPVLQAHRETKEMKGLKDQKVIPVDPRGLKEKRDLKALSELPEIKVRKVKRA